MLSIQNFNPLRRIFETKKFPHARTLRTPFLKKVQDAFFVLAGNIWESPEENHAGVFDLLTIFPIAYLIHDSVLRFWRLENLILKIILAIPVFCLLILDIPLLLLRYVVAGVFAFVSSFTIVPIICFITFFGAGGKQLETTLKASLTVSGTGRIAQGDRLHRIENQPLSSVLTDNDETDFENLKHAKLHIGYALCSMSELSNHGRSPYDFESAIYGKFYISENGEYCVRHPSGRILTNENEGVLIDLSEYEVTAENLNEKLKDSDLKRYLLEEISKILEIEPEEANSKIVLTFDQPIQGSQVDANNERIGHFDHVFDFHTPDETVNGREKSVFHALLQLNIGGVTQDAETSETLDGLLQLAR